VSKPIDSHAHILSEAFDADREHLLHALVEEVSLFIECAAEESDFTKIDQLVRAYDYVYGAVGIHPESVSAWQLHILDEMTRHLQAEKIIAIGEIGLDYYWEPERKKEQKKMLVAQLALATELGYPVILHNRDATEDLLDIIVTQNDVRGVLHCFTQGVDTAKKVLDLGLYVGIGGVLTFKNAGELLEAAEYIPLNRILLETDSPYMTPVPKRGKRNNPGYVKYVAAKLAEIKKISVEEVIEQTNKNVKALFGVESVS
jgi:TatD DNase family protein